MDDSIGKSLARGLTAEGPLKDEGGSETLNLVAIYYILYCMYMVK